MYKHWTIEEDQFIEACNSQGWTAKEIAIELDRSEGSVKARRNLLGLTGPKGCPKKYTKEQLIKLLQDAPVKTYDYLNSKESGLPSATTYRQYFGSWNAALEAAGIDVNNCVQKPEKPTKVYLVEFDGFYKVGITQQTINQRLGGRYPPYKVVLTLEFEDLSQAKEVEKSWLKAVADYHYVPDNFPEEGRGFTECFKL
jgi:hypothetical protein